MRSLPLAHAVLLVAALSACVAPRQRPAAAASRRTLVLYDETGPHGWLGELYALSTGHLASHFGAWEARPARRYRAGDQDRFDALVYVGSTYEEPLPDALLDDVLGGSRPVVWVQGNLWQLARRSPGFGAAYGFEPVAAEIGGASEVRYKGERLGRATSGVAGIASFATVRADRFEVLGEAVAADGRRVPWAVRAGHLTYLADNPFTFVDEEDRYLAFADLLFDALAPGTPERHRALVRLEDVSPVARPEDVRAAVDVLAAAGVPFSVGVTPLFVDPKGLYRPGGAGTTALAEAPALVEALRYAVAKGGTLVLHGATHQHGSRPNPYSGTSVDDFEFWTARAGPGAQVILTGPVPGDSAEWAAERVRGALREFDRAGLPRPRIFEFPHYAGSGTDARAVAPLVGAAYHRGLYFLGALAGEDRDLTRQIGQIFPYEARDVYGFAMIPENCGPYRPVGNAKDPARSVEDLLRCARLNRVVRDGWASFYYHPNLGPEPLRRIVEGVKRLGYTFVPPPLAGPPAEEDAPRRRPGATAIAAPR
ncbi:MAG TPA: DUF2334 domain-containing protein [Anaeromyxobacteraceae bacterium]|nr:DUF2334 domain-containing protein [Anaeromyxobacteraceae bacterium]